eukprot:1137734-Pelagomonas_calceolata.AAC.2
MAAAIAARSALTMVLVIPAPLVGHDWGYNVRVVDSCSYHLSSMVHMAAAIFICPIWTFGTCLGLDAVSGEKDFWLRAMFLGVCCCLQGTYLNVLKTALMPGFPAL